MHFFVGRPSSSIYLIIISCSAGQGGLVRTENNNMSRKLLDVQFRYSVAGVFVIFIGIFFIFNDSVIVFVTLIVFVLFVVFVIIFSLSVAVPDKGAWPLRTIICRAGMR